MKNSFYLIELRRFDGQFFFVTNVTGFLLGFDGAQRRRRRRRRPRRRRKWARFLSIASVSRATATARRKCRRRPPSSYSFIFFLPSYNEFYRVLPSSLPPRSSGYGRSFCFFYLYRFRLALFFLFNSSKRSTPLNNKVILPIPKIFNLIFFFRTVIHSTSEVHS